MTEPDSPATPRRLGTGMLVAAWVLALALVTSLFGGWLDRRDNPNLRVEGVVASDGMREVVLRQNRHGHYLARGYINGEPVNFLLDTGATLVSVPAPIARRVGLEAGATQPVRTAAGVVNTFATRIDRIELGSIRIDGVRGHINPHMDSDSVLLGMSFLRDLELVQRGAELTLRQYPGG